MGKETSTETSGGTCIVQWLKHPSHIAGDPRIRRLILRRGHEGYGMLWSLLEMLATSQDHFIPQPNEQGFKRFAMGLDCDETEFESFLNELVDLELLATGNDGRYRSPFVDDHVSTMLRNRANASKGGKAAARNRQHAAKTEEEGGSRVHSF